MEIYRVCNAGPRRYHLWQLDPIVSGSNRIVMDTNGGHIITLAEPCRMWGKTLLMCLFSCNEIIINRFLHMNRFKCQFTMRMKIKDYNFYDYSLPCIVFVYKAFAGPTIWKLFVNLTWCVGLRSQTFPLQWSDMSGYASEITDAATILLKPITEKNSRFLQRKPK